MKEENKASYKERGGLRIGSSYWFSSNYTWPFAKISASKEKLILTCLLNSIELKRDEVLYIERYKGFFSQGIRIYHKKIKHPFIIFWSLSVNNLINKLKDKGYKIK
jgi:hypothetical protein